MNKYLESLENKEIIEYMKILSPEFPEFLCDYIYTPAMQKQAKIGVTCGTQYFKSGMNRTWYSSLDHSVAVALIVWNFTKDKKQTLSGLFHDIATPVFKHAIDFMNGDYQKQESTENLTTDIIKNSADCLKYMQNENLITIDDLYTLSEKEVLERIENCPDKKVSENYKILKDADKIYESDILPEGNKYVVSVTPKIRYINPLVKQGSSYKRINDISKKAKDDIQKALDFKTKKYAYLNFDF